MAPNHRGIVGGDINAVPTKVIDRTAVGWSKKGPALVRADDDGSVMDADLEDFSDGDNVARASLEIIGELREPKEELRYELLLPR